MSEGWHAQRFEKTIADLQAENERLAGELAAMTEAHDALRDAYEDLLGASAEQSAELARVKAQGRKALDDADEVGRELARVKAAVREFLAMSTNITRAALAEAVGYPKHPLS